MSRFNEVERDTDGWNSLALCREVWVEEGFPYYGEDEEYAHQSDSEVEYSRSFRARRKWSRPPDRGVDNCEVGGEVGEREPVNGQWRTLEACRDTWAACTSRGFPNWEEDDEYAYQSDSGIDYSRGSHTWRRWTRSVPNKY